MPIADILMSPAKIYHAPVGEALPNENSVGYGAAWGGNWVDVGMTSLPLGLKYERTVTEVEVEQVTLAVKGIIGGEKASLETKLAEFTAANLQLAFGGTVTTTPAGPAQVAKEELVAGGSIALPILAWGFEGVYQTDAGVQFPVRIFIWRGSSVLNGNLQFSKKEAVGIPLTITAWGDSTKPSGQQIIKIQKVTAPHT
jgi:hypothetical protein